MVALDVELGGTVWRDWMAESVQLSASTIWSMPDDQVDHSPQLDPVVVEAMKQLTAWTYRRDLRHVVLGSPPFIGMFRRRRQRSKGLNDPSSRSAAIHIFKNLKYHGYRYDPPELRAWATAHGWKAADVLELGAYAEGVLAGIRYHTVPPPFGQGAIHGWREAAGEVA